MVAAAPTARSAAAHRERMRARKVATPKRRPPAINVIPARSNNVWMPPMLCVGVPPKAGDNHVVHVGGRGMGHTGEDEGTDDLSD